MSTSTMVHCDRTPTIEASTTATMGAPLQIRVRVGYVIIAEFCVYTEHQAYTDALIAAINRVPSPEVAAALSAA